MTCACSVLETVALRGRSLKSIGSQAVKKLTGLGWASWDVIVGSEMCWVPNRFPQHRIVPQLAGLRLDRICIFLKATDRKRIAHDLELCMQTWKLALGTHWAGGGRENSGRARSVPMNARSSSRTILYLGGLCGRPSPGPLGQQQLCSTAPKSAAQLRQSQALLF